MKKDRLPESDVHSYALKTKKGFRVLRQWKKNWLPQSDVHSYALKTKREFRVLRQWKKIGCHRVMYTHMHWKQRKGLGFCFKAMKKTLVATEWCATHMNWGKKKRFRVLPCFVRALSEAKFFSTSRHSAAKIVAKTRPRGGSAAALLLFVSHNIMRAAESSSSPSSWSIFFLSFFLSKPLNCIHAQSRLQKFFKILELCN